MYVKSTTHSLQTSADGSVWDGVYQLSEITKIEGQFNVQNLNGSNPSMPINRVNSAFIYVYMSDRKALEFDMNRQIVNVSTGQAYTASQANYETFLTWLNALIA